MPVSIMLDAGHGGRDPGAVYNGRQEKDDVLKLVLAIGEILQNSGIDVEYTRTTDIYETPFQKATEANEAGVDFFISIHRNSSPLANQYMGVESLIYNLSGIKYEMAENINAQLETVGFKDLGVKARPNLVVLRRTKMPAILVEVGFINSDSDNTIFDKNFNDIAQAIADGILDTLEENHIAFREELIAECAGFTTQDGSDAMAAFLEKQIPFDGVFCATDTIAFGAIDVLRRAGIQIPEQVKLTAVGNNRMSAIYSPHLTSVSLSHRTGGLEAGAILMDMIQNGNDAVRTAQMQCRLYERESTGAVE